MVKNKKAVSSMIGYVLLVSFGLIMAVIVFNYLQTYVPKDFLSCPDGASMFLKDYSYNCATNELNLTLKNNGKFNLAGFFIRGANNTEQKVTTLDLSKNLTSGSGFLLYTNFVVLEIGQGNPIKPNEEQKYLFNLTRDDVVGDILLIEIVPMRFEEQKNKLRPVSCTNAKIREELVCG